MVITSNAPSMILLVCRTGSAPRDCSCGAAQKHHPRLLFHVPWRVHTEGLVLVEGNISTLEDLNHLGLPQKQPGDEMESSLEDASVFVPARRGA